METRLLQFSVDGKAIEKTVKILGILSRTWTIPVIRVLNTEDESSFNSLKRGLHKVTAKTLSKTLGDLVRAGIADRTVVPSSPPRVLYSLSSKGKELLPLLEEIQIWDEKWQNVVISDPEVPLHDA